MERSRIRLCRIALVASLLVCLGQVSAEVRHIYLATGNDGRIIRVDGDGGSPVTVIDRTPDTEIATLTIDPFAEQLYWCGNGATLGRGDDIFRSRLDGTGQILIMEFSDIPGVANTGDPNTLLVDPLRETLTIGGDDTHDIIRTDLDGSNLVVAVPRFTDDAYIFGMDIDMARGVLYWAACCPDGGDEGIMRQSLATDERVDGPWDNLEINPRGLAVDPLNDQLYWGRDLEIVRANLDATDVEVILPKLPRVDRVKLDVLGGKVYWLGGLKYLKGQPVRSLWRADLDGGDIDTVIEDTPMADFYLELAPVDDAEFRILSARLTDEGLLLAWSGSPGERYQIEGSPDLADGEWSVVETGWPSTAVGVTAYLVKPERLGSLRYLRVRR